MSFGISGSNTSTFMVGADVVVAWVDNGVANAVDYYLTSRQQVIIITLQIPKHDTVSIMCICVYIFIIKDGTDTLLHEYHKWITC